jgi:hypothetical protein
MKGGDHVAAMRGPQTLATDLVDYPEQVKACLSLSLTDYFEAYDYFYNIIHDAGVPVSAWLPLVWPGKFYVPACDFSYMVSNSMFQEFFLPGIVEECKHYERSVYHLDGIGALRHLDDILAVKEIGAVQWAPGAGNYGIARWIDVYRRIQKAGKGIELWCYLEELPQVMENLKPDGIWFSNIVGVNDTETADSVMKTLSKWH